MDLLKNLNIDKIRNAAEDALNQAKPKTDVEARIYEALSHKNWGSSSTLMNEIARDSFDYDKFNTVTRIIWESLDHPRPAAWRVVFKALTLLEHLIKNGSERCVDDGRNHSHVLRALFNFNYYEGTVDRGQGVREKSKQVVELIGDDERIREERTKAKQLREKFGGNMGGASNTGSMSGIGGGGSGYAGYGNDNSGGYSGSGGGGGGGYGDSGIGSSGGYSDAAAATNNTNSFSGRYSEEVEASDNNAPTFAAIPPKKTKKKSKKSKKKKEKSFEESEVPAPAPEVDLLAMDDPVPAADDGFDAFQGAPAAAEESFDAFQSGSAQPTTNAGFDAFQSAPAQQPSTNAGFDAFQSAPAPTQQQSQFDAFGTNAAPNNSQNFDAFGSNGNFGGNTNSMNNAFGNMNMGGNSMMGTQQQQIIGNVMGGSQSNIMGGQRGNNVMGGQSKPVSASDDDFGDFNDGSSGKSAADPLSNLISLDSLTMNKKNVDKTKEPVLFNDAAKAYVVSGAQHKPVGTTKAAADMAFSGVDGLHKQTSFSGNMNPMNSMGGNFQSGQSVMNRGGNNNMMNGMQQQAMGGMNNNMGMMGGMSNNMGGMSQQRNMYGMSQTQGNNMDNGMNNNMNGRNNNSGGMNQQGMMGGTNQGMNQGMMGGMNQGMNQGMMGGNSMNQGNSTMGGQPMGGWQ